MEWDLSVSERVIRWLRLKIYVLLHSIESADSLVRHKQITRAHTHSRDSLGITLESDGWGGEIDMYVILYTHDGWLDTRTRGQVPIYNM